MLRKNKKKTQKNILLRILTTILSRKVCKLYGHLRKTVLEDTHHSTIEECPGPYTRCHEKLMFEDTHYYTIEESL